MTKKELKNFLLEKSKNLKEEEKLYLKEEIKTIDLGMPEWDKVIELYNKGEKIENKYNILALYLLGVSDYPKKLEHRWELADVADIDLDFSPDGRDKIKEYLSNKYGKDNCVSIGTYGSLGVKGSFQEVCRVYDIPPKEYIKISKLLTDDIKDLSIEEVVEKIPQLKTFLNKYKEVADAMTRLTGIKKSIGCIAWDQTLYGNDVKISELKDSDVVYYIDKEYNIKPNKYATLIYSGIKECIKIYFDDNTSLVCTPDHLIYTINRGYVEASDLKSSDSVSSIKNWQLTVKKVINKVSVGEQKVYDISMNIKKDSFIDNEPCFIVENTLVHNSHAGGFIVSSDSVVENIPIVKSSKNWVSGWQESGAIKELEALGFIKVDILGLAAVEQIRQAVEEIKKRHTKNKLPEDIYDVDVNDPKVYDFINTLELDNVFQMESKVFVEAVRKIKPRKLSDISNISTLIRPGAACTVDEYARSKMDKTKTPRCLWDVFYHTRGWLIYQEQLMQVLMNLGGFDIFEADKIRRLVRKIGKAKTSDENRQEMLDQTKKVYDKYIKNAINKIKTEDGWDEKTAEQYAKRQWDAILGQAKYSFNMPHSYSYSLVGYVQAWLKTYYPVEFWVATLNTIDRGREKYNQSSLGKYINTITKSGINVRKPNVNYSDINFTADKDGNIYFALSYIKDVGSGSDLVIKNRPYSDWKDFLKKAKENKINKRVVKALIFSGALDFDDDISKRNDKWNEYISLSKKNKEESVNFSYFKLIEIEYDYCKYSFSGVPSYLISKHKNSKLVSERDRSKKLCSVVGYVKDITNKKSKKSGKNYLLLTITDFRETLSVFVFGDEYKNYISNKINKGQLVKVIIKNDDNWIKLPWSKECNNKFPIEVINGA